MINIIGFIILVIAFYYVIKEYEKSKITNCCDLMSKWYEREERIAQKLYETQIKNGIPDETAKQILERSRDHIDRLREKDRSVTLMS